MYSISNILNWFAKKNLSTQIIIALYLLITFFLLVVFIFLSIPSGDFSNIIKMLFALTSMFIIFFVGLVEDIKRYKN